METLVYGVIIFGLLAIAAMAITDRRAFFQANMIAPLVVFFIIMAILLVGVSGR